MTEKHLNKRKPVLPTTNMVTSSAIVEQLHIEDMVIKVEGRSSCYFIRLKYKGCPNLKKFMIHSGSEPPKKVPISFNEKEVLVDMGRSGFIRDIYQLLQNDMSASTTNRFDGIVKYLRWLDSSDLKPVGEDFFEWSLVDSYMDYCALMVQQGASKSLWKDAKTCISWFLRQKGRASDAGKLPVIKIGKTGTKTHNAFDLERELKPIAKALFRAFKGFKTHYENNTTPERHPLYDELLFNSNAGKEGWKWKTLGANKAAFKAAIMRTNPLNPFVQISMMICFMFTGMNTNPLSKVKVRDIRFKQVQGGKYIIDATKARASHLEIDNTLGFSKYAKEFIESWISIVNKMTDGDSDAPLFPRFTNDGRVISYSETAISPQAATNKLLKKLGLNSISSTKFRKTKLDALFRVTESVYLVAMSANNSMKVISKTYSNGVESVHEKNLAASMDATFKIAKGNDFDTSLSEAKYNFSDILDDYEYKNLRKNKNRTHESRTPIGVRCNDNTKGAAKVISKSLKRQGLNVADEESICTDFLGCFECSEHALVASIDDIWLMLSFKDTLQQLQQLPAVNSMPESRYMNIFNTIEGVLKRFYEKSKTNYLAAEEKHKASAHPMYSNALSLNDLLDSFK